jgi:hypothetical protein
MKKRLLGLGLLVTSFIANAQTAVTNTGTLYISSNSDIFYAVGDFTNGSTALTNNGQLYIEGTLTNNQTPATVGIGTLHLNGSSAQSVAGTATFKTYNLNTNNASGITLNNNLSISGTHTFIAGDIASSVTPNYLVYESGSNYTGATDARHVTGWVKKIGNTGFIFPTGNGTYLRQIETSNLSASIEFNAKYRGATQNTNNLQSPLVVVNPNEYWTLDNITQSGTTAQVTLNWDNSKVAFPEYVLIDLRSARYNTSNLWESTGGSATGSVTTTGSITSNSLSAFGSLSIGSITFTVPLNFLSIIAQRKTDYTLVEWKTANEANVKHHEIQRSKGNNIFTTIATQPARNIIDKQTYSHNDFDKLEGTIYYRIKSVDFDGKTKYSTVVSVHYNGIAETISIRNNPVAGTIYLSLSSVKNKPYNYQLIAANGNIVQQGNLQYGGTGSMSISLQPSVVSGSSYILILNDGVKISTHKIIVR